MTRGKVATAVARVGLLFLLAVVGFVAWSGAVGAATTPPEVSPAAPPPASGPPPTNPSENAALVAAAVSTYGIPAAQSAQDMDVQARAPRIVNQLQQELGSGYAGVWFDMQKAKFMIDVAPSTDTSRVAQVESDLGITADSDQVPVKYTWDQLESVEAQWQAVAAMLPASDVPIVGISAQDNAVVVSLGTNAPAADADTIAASIAAADSAGTPVEFERSNFTSPPVPAVAVMRQRGASCPFRRSRRGMLPARRHRRRPACRQQALQR